MKTVRTYGKAPFVPDWVQRYYRWKPRQKLVALFWAGGGVLLTLAIVTPALMRRDGVEETASATYFWILFGCFLAWTFGGMLLRTRAEVRQRQARQWVVDAGKGVFNLSCYRLEDIEMKTAERALALIAHAVHLMPHEAPNAMTRWFWDGKALLDLLFPDSDDRPYEIAALRVIYPLERLKAERDTVPPALLDLVLALERAREKKAAAA